ncbi:unnamed protein product [Symbiodinium pilosum]|uniref:Uncharacterized protein n=1 Tax=Symbiodinium pilosum TaxID=2952 RepID=A0A812IWC8_SYMPI|nr:unnamed protein product [Symbiodinium pilosum]
MFVQGLGFVQRSAYNKRAKPPALQPIQEEFSEVFCSQASWLCTETFDCLNHTGKLQSEDKLDKQIATASGEPDLTSWCYFQSNWDNVVKSCLVDQDLTRSAHQVYHQVLQQHPQDENDAKYCFLSGHCEDRELNSNSTMEAATKVCDERYPEPDGWKSVGFLDVEMQPLSTKAQADRISKIACARGSYHCTVAYCQETYCKMDHYEQIGGPSGQK